MASVMMTSAQRLTEHDLGVVAVLRTAERYEMDVHGVLRGSGSVAPEAAPGRPGYSGGRPGRVLAVPPLGSRATSRAGERRAPSCRQPAPSRGPEQDCP